MLRSSRLLSTAVLVLLWLPVLPPGSGTSGALLPLSTAQAAPYVDRSGLTPGRFVWHPTASLDGPVVIVASLAHQTLHVYRGGEEIGIAPFARPLRGPMRAGLYSIVGKPTVRAAGASRGVAVVTWRARVVFREADGQAGKLAAGTIALPRAFARLLAKATDAGAALIVAEERGLPERLVQDWPGGGLDRQVAQAAGMAVPAASGAPLPPRKPRSHTAIIVSLRDGTAVIVEDTREVGRLDIKPGLPALDLGTHIYSVTRAATVTERTKWLGFAIGRTPLEPGIRSSTAEAQLARLSFATVEDAQRVRSLMETGASLVIGDQPATGERIATGEEIAALATEQPQARREGVRARRSGATLNIARQRQARAARARTRPQTPEAVQFSADTFFFSR